MADLTFGEKLIIARNKLNLYADDGVFVPGPGEQRASAA